ncbi:MULTISPECIES: DUF1328 domain-containing protein [Halococcus]|uniref:UPF0391 membrane protein C450_16415 n=1 Tax=Halococcus salifodinae DSM 8989 TaxID=1227456 RepID=M0MYE5_9EURY|nr:MULTISPECIES: DUF1328 domain-containing protein [Halococcus]EMA49874.1 membrane protein ytjA [Halococcus salifodinae DSM 8989]
MLATLTGTVLQSGGFIELAIGFLVLALIAYVVGAQGIAGISMEIARILVIVFIILAVVSFFL